MKQRVGKGAVAVIIPARDREHDLRRCLAALAHENNSFQELIVVDDGSTDGTGNVAAELGARVIRLEGQGPAAARNAGARAAAADILVFIDADCEAQSGCIRELLQPLSEPTTAAVRGAYVTFQTNLVARFVQLEMAEKQALMAKSRRVTILDTACAAYRAEVFWRYGGFDESFAGTTAEDVELSFRLAAAGELMLFAPEAMVAHRHPSSLTRYCWRKLRFGFFRARIYSVHPDQVRGDGYTPRSMPVQILLSASLLMALATEPFNPSAKLLAAVIAVSFVGSCVPLLRRALRTDRGLAVAVVPLLLLRSWCQAFGLIGGIISILLRVPRHRHLTCEPQLSPAATDVR